VVDVPGLLAIAAPPFIFHLFCLVFPQTCFTFTHQTKCILPSVSPKSVCGILLCVGCYATGWLALGFVSNLDLFVLFNPIHVTVVVLCAALPVPLGQGVH
jgi:hypothetical protein